MSVPFAMDPPPVPAPLTVPRPIIHRPESVQDWGNRKAKNTDLYESNELNNTMKITDQELFALLVPQQIFHRPRSAQDREIQPMAKTTDRYESNELNDTMRTTEEKLSVPSAMDPLQVQAPLTIPRSIIHRPQSVHDWENQKAKITNLYLSNELKDAMKIMEQQHGFKATYAIIPLHSVDSA